MLAVACLAMQALAVAIHAPATSRIATASIGGPLEFVVICSAHGTRTIAVDADGNEVDPPRHDAGFNCPLCLVLGGVALASPASAGGVDVSWAPVLPRPLAVVPVLYSAVPHTYTARGPPSAIAV